MALPGMLYVGNQMQKHGKGLTMIEVLAPLFQSEGYAVIAVSDKKNPLFRIAHMLWTAITQSSKYQYLLIDTYSTTNFYYALLLSLWGKLAGKKVVLNLHGGNLAHRLQHKPAFLTWMLHNSHKNIAPSAFLKEQLAGAGAPIEVIPNPIQGAAFTHRERKSFEPHFIWFRGFLDFYQPVKVIEVMAALKPHFPSVRLTMCGPDKGDGTYQKCEALIKQEGLEEEVRMVGPVTHQTLNQLGAACDLFINLSQIDNTPSALLEAGLMGLAVITTPAGGIPHMVDADAVFFVEDATATEIARTIKHLLTNQQEMMKQKTALLHKTAKHTQWQAISPKWKQILVP